MDSDRLTTSVYTRSKFNNMTIIWKDIPGYEGYYQASDQGEIRSLDRQIKHGEYSYVRKGVVRVPFENQGYYNITLNKAGIEITYPVHRLIAMTFIPNPNDLPCVNHIDGNKQNNIVTNLEWITYADNTQHAIATGLFNPEQSRINGCKATDVVAIRVKCEDTGQVFESIKAAERYIGSECIKDNIHKNKRSHSGRGWLFSIISEEYYQSHKDDMVDVDKCNRIHDEIRQRIKSQGKAVKIYCVERNIHYTSRSAAARDNNMNIETINLAIKENRKAKGLTFIIDK